MPQNMPHKLLELLTNGPLFRPTSPLRFCRLLHRERGKEAMLGFGGFSHAKEARIIHLQVKVRWLSGGHRRGDPSNRSPGQLVLAFQAG